MKKFTTKDITTVTAGIGLTLALVLTGNIGLQPETETSAFAAAAPASKPATPTSYAEVTARLDRGGSLFAYVGTAKWLADLEKKVEEFRAPVTQAMPKSEREELDKAFEVGLGLIRRTGVQEISGVGISAVPLGENLHRTKFFLHHHKDSGQGFLWSVFGGEAHELNGLDLMPADAVAAAYSDLNLKALWTTVTNELAAVGDPKIKDALAMIPAQFEALAQMKLGTLLDGLGGEFGWALMLNDKVRLPLPIPSPEPLDIPTPELMLVAKVTEKAIFDRVAGLMKGIPNVTVVEEEGVHQIRVPALIPFVPALSPVVAFDGEHLFVVNQPAVLKKVLAAKRGDEPNLGSNPEYARLAAGLPRSGNAFTFVSERLGKEVVAFMTKTSAGQGDQPENPVAAMFGKPTSTASIFSNTEEGWLSTTVGNQSASEVLVNALTSSALTMGAIAIPNFLKARSTAQNNSCIANLKQLDGATQQWALENGKGAKDKPEPSAILKFVRDGKLPTCPESGTYSFGDQVSMSPTCSIPGHSL
jgi:hypothetical protein